MSGPITYKDGTIHGIQNGDIFKVTINLNKNDDQYSFASETVEIFRDSNKFATLTFNNDEITIGGGDNTYLNKNEVYELPKSKKRKTTKIYNKTLSRKKH